MVEVLVEHDYTAIEPDELTIKKGDVIREVVRMKGGWWEGLLNDKRGMFPDSFVKEIEIESSSSLFSKKSVSELRQCRVLFSYKQDHIDELELNVGDVINVLGEEEEGWWRGILNGRKGVFPSNFVEEIRSKFGSREDLTNANELDRIPILPPKPSKLVCQVKYSYKAQNDDELTLKENDIISLISKDGQDPGWWKGELNGQIGVFPDNFVVILENNERKSNKTESTSTTFKTTTVASQRNSLDERETDNVNRITPSVLNKKPAVPVKKSPTTPSPQGGILAGLRKKIVETASSGKNHSKVVETKEPKDVEKGSTEVKMTKSPDIVDGGSGSRMQPQLLKVTELRDDIKEELLLENAFDHVERSSMLSDVRATRAKAPGRRPPSVVFKDGEPGVVNGNLDHNHLDMLTEHLSNSRPTSMNDQGEFVEVKPKVREWEKHRAPWLEEMKLNQAKRTSTSPSNEPSKLKLTPTDKSAASDIDEPKSPLDKSEASIDLSASLSPINNIMKTSPNEKISVVLRNKNPQSNIKPQAVNTNDLQKHDVPKPLSINSTTSSIPTRSTNNRNVTSPRTVGSSSPDIKATGDINHENVCVVQYMELLQRIEKLEISMETQKTTYTAIIEELKGKILRLETEIRNYNA